MSLAELLVFGWGAIFTVQLWTVRELIRLRGEVSHLKGRINGLPRRPGQRG